MDAPTQPPVAFSGTMSDELDRLEILAGRIGMNKPEQALSMLRGLDAVHQRLQELPEDSSSRAQSAAQFDSLVARLHKEAGLFLRDLGGAYKLQAAREERQPAQENEWWYLDAWLAEKRRASLKRSLITGGIILGILAVLAVLYQAFLAPDPKLTAVYGAQTTAQDGLMAGDYDKAMQSVEEGLKVDPTDLSLLAMKGVIYEKTGKADLAEKAYSDAQRAAPNQVDFLLSRGQAYLMSAAPEKGLADGEQVIKLDAKNAQGYLLRGQAYEMLKQEQKALDDYNKAFDAAEAAGQTQLSAIIRTRIAYLVQGMNAQLPGVPTPSLVK